MSQKCILSLSVSLYLTTTVSTNFDAAFIGHEENSILRSLAIKSSTSHYENFTCAVEKTASIGKDTTFIVGIKAYTELMIYDAAPPALQLIPIIVALRFLFVICKR